MKKDYDGFLQRHPTPDSLGLTQAGAATTWWLSALAAAVRAPRSYLLLGAGAVAVAVCVMLILPPPDKGVSPPLPGVQRTGGEGIRMKGDSVMELAVVRNGKSFSFDAQPLTEGDILAFRYSTDLGYLLVVSVEESGKFNQLWPAAGDGSGAIAKGEKLELDQAFRLDDSLHTEFVFALFSERPLSVHSVGETASGAARSLFEAGAEDEPARLPIDCDQVSWKLRKVQP